MLLAILGSHRLAGHVEIIIEIYSIIHAFLKFSLGYKEPGCKRKGRSTKHGDNDVYFLNFCAYLVVGYLWVP